MLLFMFQTAYANYPRSDLGAALAVVALMIMFQTAYANYPRSDIQRDKQYAGMTVVVSNRLRELPSF